MKKFNLFLLAATTAAFIGCHGNLHVSSPDGVVTAQIVQENDRLALKILLRGMEADRWHHLL